MRARGRSVSFTAFALFTRHRMLEFARVVEVVRNGKTVRRMVNSKDLTPEEVARLHRPTQ